MTLDNKQNLVEQTLPGCQQQLSHSGRKTTPTPIDSFPPPPTAADPSNTLQLHLLPPLVPSADKCLQVCPPKSIPQAVFVTLSPPPSVTQEPPHPVIPMIRPPWRSLHAVCGTFNGILCGWLDSPHTTRMNSPHGQRVHVQLPPDATVTDLHFPRHLNFNHHAKN